MSAACTGCRGRGWVWALTDWSKCAACYGSGEPGVRAPDEILTSSGRVSRGVHYMYGPAKPKPALAPLKGGRP